MRHAGSNASWTYAAESTTKHEGKDWCHSQPKVEGLRDVDARCDIAALCKQQGPQKKAQAARPTVRPVCRRRSFDVRPRRALMRNGPHGAEATSQKPDVDLSFRCGLS